jgi:hypothetical protein
MTTDAYNLANVKRSSQALANSQKMDLCCLKFPLLGLDTIGEHSHIESWISLSLHILTFSPRVSIRKILIEIILLEPKNPEESVAFAEELYCSPTI